MINLENVLSEWDKDSIIDDRHLDEEGKKTASLHSKYLRMLTVSKLQLKRVELEQKQLLKSKWLYYNGKMTADEIDGLGWAYDPFDGLKILKQDLDRYYDADPDIQKSIEKVEYWKTVTDTLKEILDSVKWRHQTIRNMIDWKKFEAGA